MSNWTVICRVQDIPVLGARRVARPQGLPVAVFRISNDEVFALLDRCPHKAGPLSQGIVSGRQVACPLHNWNIGLDDGCAKGADSGCTPNFACKVEGGTVYLDASELASKALDLEPPKAGPALPPLACRGRQQNPAGAKVQPGT
jgi:nitrite reductase (NADH) small subunit